MIPRNFGIIGGKSISKDLNSLNANNFSMGDRYASVIGAGIKSDYLKNI
jgi:hypothetical protein